MTEPDARELLLSLRSPARPEEAARAVRALASLSSPFARDALREALSSPLGVVRLEALRKLPPSAVGADDGPLGEGEETRALLSAVVARDPSPPVRRAAIRALGHPLARAPGGLIALVASLDDPVWRVRRDALGALLSWGTTPALRRAIVEAALPLARSSAAAHGALHWLEDRWGMARSPLPRPPPRRPDPADLARLPFHDPDPASLLARMSRLSPSELAPHLGQMPSLLALQDGKPQHDALEALRSFAARLLVARAGPAEAALVACLLDEPRLPFAPSWAEWFLTEAPAPLLDEAARRLLDRGQLEGRPAPAGALSWALARLPHLARAEWLAYPSPRVRAAAARAIARASPGEARDLLPPRLAGEGDREARLALIEALSGLAGPPVVDEPPRSRAEQRALAGLRARAIAAASDERFWLACASADDSLLRALCARELSASALPLPPSLSSALEALGRDPSPQVSLSLSGPFSRGAAPLGDGPPAPRGPRSPRGSAAYFPMTMLQDEPSTRPRSAPLWPPSPSGARPLGEGGPLVSPLGLSGRYGLPERGLAEAVEAGLNLIFWEPGYEGLTRSLRRLGGPWQKRLALVAGSFEATGEAVRLDVERALSLLGIEQIGVFLLFWVRSPARLSDDVLSALARLVDEGKIGRWGVSLHDRSLALLALQKGAPVVMIRHSAAHPGAEAQVFPEAKARGAGVLTFTNLCYGQLLLPTPSAPAPSAPELYRYSLSQPGVSACVSAPRTLVELRENLSVLASPPLSPDRQAELRQFGRSAYVDGRAFRELVRDR